MPSLKGRKQYTGSRIKRANQILNHPYAPLYRALAKVGFEFRLRDGALRTPIYRTVKIPPLMAGLAIYTRDGHLRFMLTPNLGAEDVPRKTHPWVYRGFYHDPERGIDLPSSHSYLEPGRDFTQEIKTYVNPDNLGRVELYRRASRPMRKPHAPTVAAKAKAKPRKKTPVKRRTASPVKRRSR